MRRHPDNPLITPEIVKPSHPGYRVRGAFNPCAVIHDGEVLLLLRVAEDCIPEAGCLLETSVDELLSRT